MPTRAEVPDVCAIIETDLENDQVEPFITTANVFIDDNLLVADPPLSENTLKQIEIYLSAHFLTFFDPRASKEEADGVRFTFESDTALGLDSSKYGQTAQVLDSSGILSQLNKKDRIPFRPFRVGNEITIDEQNL